MSAVLADTGPLYALADPHDQYHDRAVGESDRIQSAGTQIILICPILLETHTLILKRLGTRLARRWLGEVMDGTDLLNPVGDDFLRAVQRSISFPDQPFSLFDCVLAELSELLHLPIWTFDHHFDLMRVEVWR